ncbi:MAG: helix-hairpin-helix domain-containing protein [Proteobacteria bacterium]|nr:helix-hairpin-helix domain-containing protein [Pseudomonadota bacterium]
MKVTQILKTLMAGLVFFFSWASFCYGENLTVSVLDVGQADAILIEHAGKRVLIDSGEQKDQAMEILKKKGINSFDLVVATHPHADHIGGMQNILTNFNVKVYMDNGFPHTTNQYDALMTVAEQKVAAGMRYMTGRQGQRLNFGPDAHFEVLWPTDEGLKNTRSDINANSVVLKLIHGNNCFLFTGDAEAETERAILPLVDKCQVYKVSHHGSPHSSIPELLDKIQPDYALISCGLANKHGHPGQTTLASFKSRNTKYYRTDWQGEITVVSDGDHISVTTEKNLTQEDLPCININYASEADFSVLKGVGGKTTEAVMQVRAKHPGPFRSVDEFIQALPEQPAKRLNKLRDYLSVSCPNDGYGTLGISSPSPAPVQAAPSAPLVQAAVPAAPAPVAPSAPAAAAGQLVNINTADVNALAAMPGMGMGKAQKAIDDRNANGPFKSCKDLQRVNGIGKKTVDKLLSVCTVAE